MGKMGSSYLFYISPYVQQCCLELLKYQEAKLTITCVLVKKREVKNI